MEKYQRFYVLSNKASESKCSCKQSINVSKFLQNVKEHSFFVPSAPSLLSHMCVEPQVHSACLWPARVFQACFLAFLRVFLGLVEYVTMPCRCHFNEK